MAVALQRVNTKDHALGSALASLAQSSAVAPSGPPPESEVITASRVIPARDAAYGAFPRVIDERLLSVLSKGGIERPYSHQSEAITHAIEGRHVVVVTPTASGKTLCYNVPSPQYDSRPAHGSRALPVSDQGLGSGPAG